eukprot:9046747-Heterocapsa_arctica.AAC.1
MFDIRHAVIRPALDSFTQDVVEIGTAFLFVLDNNVQLSRPISSSRTSASSRCNRRVYPVVHLRQ